VRDVNLIDIIDNFTKIHNELIEKLIKTQIDYPLTIYGNFLSFLQESIHIFVEENQWILKVDLFDIKIDKLFESFQHIDQKIFSLYIGFVLSYAGYYDEVARELLLYHSSADSNQFKNPLSNKWTLNEWISAFDLQLDLKNEQIGTFNCWYGAYFKESFGNNKKRNLYIITYLIYPYPFDYRAFLDYLIEEYLANFGKKSAVSSVIRFIKSESENFL